MEGDTWYQVLAPHTLTHVTLAPSHIHVHIHWHTHTYATHTYICKKKQLMLFCLYLPRTQGTRLRHILSLLFTYWQENDALLFHDSINRGNWTWTVMWFYQLDGGEVELQLQQLMWVTHSIMAWCVCISSFQWRECTVEISKAVLSMEQKWPVVCHDIFLWIWALITMDFDYICLQRRLVRLPSYSNYFSMHVLQI